MRLSFRYRLGRRSNASVEFAIFAPIMLLIFMGVAEMATAYRTYAKLNAVAANVAAMVSVAQAVSVQSAPASFSSATGSSSQPPYTAFTPQDQEQLLSLPDACAGAVMGVAPLPTNNMQIDIASITEETSPNVPTSAAGTGSSSGLSTSVTYDGWEFDQSVSGTTCNPATTTTILSNVVQNSSGSLVSGNATATTVAGMLNEPCDNVIIVQVSLPYSGLFGLFLRSAITLQQTAFGRWAIAQPLTELMCDRCYVLGGTTSTLNANSDKLTNTQAQTCNSSNPATY